MSRPPDQSGPDPHGDGAGEPPLERLLAADDLPVRRELLRQISVLEQRLTDSLIDHAPYERLPALPTRGPALLGTAELEQVRDELVAAIAELHDRVAREFSSELNAIPVGRQGSGRLARLLRRIGQR